MYYYAKSKRTVEHNFISNNAKAYA
jgi:hypothetical protein